VNRETLIEKLKTEPDIRVWQQIRNLSPYGFIFGSMKAIPWPVEGGTEEQYAKRCVEFVSQLKDTFHLPDNDEPLATGGIIRGVPNLEIDEIEPAVAYPVIKSPEYKEEQGGNGR